MLFHVRSNREQLAANRAANKKQDAAKAAAVLEQLRRVTAAANKITGVTA